MVGWTTCFHVRNSQSRSQQRSKVNLSLNLDRILVWIVTLGSAAKGPMILKNHLPGSRVVCQTDTFQSDQSVPGAGSPQQPSVTVWLLPAGLTGSQRLKKCQKMRFIHRDEETSRLSQRKLLDCRVLHFIFCLSNTGNVITAFSLSFFTVRNKTEGGHVPLEDATTPK